MSRDSFRRFTTWVLGANLFVIVWGALVRATGSGAGCGSNWPLCNGEVVPMSGGLHTMIEYTHRATSGVVLVLGLILLVQARRLFGPGEPTRRAATWSFGFLLAEAGIGAGLVLLELVGTNESAARAVWMAVHLANTFFLLAALTATREFASGLAGPDSAPKPGRRRTAVLALLGTLAIGITGAIAALGDTLYPATSLAHGLQQDVSASQLLVRLRVVHPAVAVLVGIWLLGVAARNRRQARSSARHRKLSNAVALLIWTQLAMGALNVVLLAPVWAQLVHLLLADLLWIALVGMLLHSLAPATATESPTAPRRAGSDDLAPAPAG